MDEIDQHILAILQHNGRMTLTDLAEQVGLTLSPCQRRVRELERRGVIVGYRAVVDPAALGRGLEVIVHVEIRADDIRTIREFESTVASYDEVVELRRMFSKPDYILHVAVADHGAYETFLTAKLMGLPAIERIQSHLTMKLVKGSD